MLGNSAFGLGPSCRFKNKSKRNNKGQFIKPDFFRSLFEEAGKRILSLICIVLSEVGNIQYLKYCVHLLGPFFKKKKLKQFTKFKRWLLFKGDSCLQIHFCIRTCTMCNLPINGKLHIVHLYSEELGFSQFLL